MGTKKLNLINKTFINSPRESKQTERNYFNPKKTIAMTFLSWKKTTASHGNIKYLAAW
jgi:hypothetical protein